jgi:hypothetical protein
VSASNINESCTPPSAVGTILKIRPIAFEPARIFVPEGNGTSCIRRAVIVSPALLFREFNEEFNRNGKIVPAGIVFWAIN